MSTRMRKSAQSFARWLLGVAVLLALHPDVAYAQNLVAHEDEQTLTTSGVEFSPGVFRLEPNGQRIKLLCLQVGARWQHVGTDRECPNPLPPELRPEIARFALDKTFLGVRNLGVDTRQWQDAQAGRAGATSLQRRVGDSFQYRIGTADVRWSFRSADLPHELRTPIPGAAIAVHFGRNFSDELRPALFEGGMSTLVEASIAVPKADLTGQAHMGVSMAIGLFLPTTSGKSRGLTMIVSIYHPDPKGPAETIRSDQRVNFGSARLGAGSRYVIAAANRQKTSPWPVPQRFAFKISKESLRNLMMDTNRRGDPAGVSKDAYDLGRLEDARIASITVRNEYSSLNRGNVEAEVVVDYLRLVREVAR